jgi:hypothetical protein
LPRTTIAAYTRKESRPNFYRIPEQEELVYICEVLPDPDYPLRRTEKCWAEEAGFELGEGYGNFFLCQLNFEKE